MTQKEYALFTIAVIVITPAITLARYDDWLH